ncbi:MAG: tetratricopeptide repeat protein [Flavobacteriales bacterium]
MKNSFTYIVLLFVLMACKAGKQVNTGESDTRGAQPDLIFQEKFFAAQLEKSKDNLEKAYILFEECLQLQPQNDAVHFELGRMDLQMKNNAGEALTHAKAALLTKPKNPWYHLLSGNSYMSLGNYDMAVKSYIQVAVLNPNDNAIYYEIADAQLLQMKWADAIETFDELELKTGPDEELTIQKHQLYLQLNEPEKAGKELEKLANAFPHEPRYWSLAAQYYTTIGNSEKVAWAMEQMVKTDPDNGEVHFALSEYHAANGDDKRSYEELVLSFETTDISIDQKMAVLLKYFALTDFDLTYLPQAYQLLSITERVHPAEAKAYSIYGDFLAREGRDVEALQKYRKACELDPNHSIIWQQMLEMDLDLRDYSALKSESEKALELFPTIPQFYYMHAMASQAMTQYDSAIMMLNTGKELVVEDDALLTRFYTTLGAVYHQKTEYTNSDQAFESALKLQPENALTLNNYAYYLALRKSNLDKASTMAVKANMLQPNHATYEDTYATVLFQLANYKEALAWIEKAIEHNEPQGDQLERLGDILAQLNRNAEAVSKWKEAKALGGTSANIDKKIAEQRYIE